MDLKPGIKLDPIEVIEFLRAQSEVFLFILQREHIRLCEL